MFEFVIFLIGFVILTVSAVVIIRLKNTNLQLMVGINQAIKDVEYARLQLKGGGVEKEHLLSFLNETREMAYKYIEDVHKALLEYKSEIEEDLKNPNDSSHIRLQEAFQKLQKIYPKDVPND